MTIERSAVVSDAGTSDPETIARILQSLSPPKDSTISPAFPHLPSHLPKPPDSEQEIIDYQDESRNPPAATDSKTIPLLTINLMVGKNPDGSFNPDVAIARQPNADMITKIIENILEEKRPPDSLPPRSSLLKASISIPGFHPSSSHGSGMTLAQATIPANMMYVSDPSLIREIRTRLTTDKTPGESEAIRCLAVLYWSLMVTMSDYLSTPDYPALRILIPRETLAIFPLKEISISQLHPSLIQK